MRTELARARSLRVNHCISSISMAGRMKLSATPSSRRSTASSQKWRITPVKAASTPHAMSAPATSRRAPK